MSLSTPLWTPQKLLLFPWVILGDFSLVQPGLGSLQSGNIQSMTAATTAICSLPKTLQGEEQAVTSAVPQLGGRKVGKKIPGIAAWKVLPVVGREQGKEKMLDLLSVRWEQLFASQPDIFQAALSTAWAGSLMETTGKAPDSLRFLEIPWDSLRFLAQQLLWISAVVVVTPGTGQGQVNRSFCCLQVVWDRNNGNSWGWQRETDGIRVAIGFVHIQVMREGLFLSHHLQISSLQRNVMVGVSREIFCFSLKIILAFFLTSSLGLSWTVWS